MTIKTIRRQIDAIDRKIAKALQARWGWVGRIKKFKKLRPQEAGYRPYREVEIYHKLPNSRQVSRDEYWTIWKELMTTTVVRENPFLVAVAQDFFAQHGFELAQEFGRRTQWLTKKSGRGLSTAAVLQLLAKRRVGLAVVPIGAVGEFLRYQPRVTIVNVFPSFVFAGQKGRLNNKTIKGLIVAWQAEESREGRESLAVTIDKSGKKFLLARAEKMQLSQAIGFVPRPPQWHG